MHVEEPACVECGEVHRGWDDHQHRHADPKGANGGGEEGWEVEVGGECKETTVKKRKSKRKSER